MKRNEAGVLEAEAREKKAEVFRLNEKMQKHLAKADAFHSMGTKLATLRGGIQAEMAQVLQSTVQIHFNSISALRKKICSCETAAYRHDSIADRLHADGRKLQHLEQRRSQRPYINVIEI